MEKKLIEIELTNGMKARVDDVDFELVRGYRWSRLKSGDQSYAITYWMDGAKKKHLLMHRLILGVSDGQFVDHSDSDGLNNTRENIRICTHSENMRNRKTRKDLKSGFRGVLKIGNKFRGRLIFEKKTYSKNFDSEVDASMWVEKMRAKLHGEFAYNPEKDARLSIRK